MPDIFGSDTDSGSSRGSDGGGDNELASVGLRPGEREGRFMSDHLRENCKSPLPKCHTSSAPSSPVTISPAIPQSYGSSYTTRLSARGLITTGDEAGMAIAMDFITEGLTLKECPHKKSSPFHRSMPLFAWTLHTGH